MVRGIAPRIFYAIVDSVSRAVISPDEKKLPMALNFEIIKILQTAVEPNVFTPRAAYDGRKNLFASKKYDFGDVGEVRLLRSFFFHSASVL